MSLFVNYLVKFEHLSQKIQIIKNTIIKSKPTILDLPYMNEGLGMCGFGRKTRHVDKSSPKLI